MPFFISNVIIVEPMLNFLKMKSQETAPIVGKLYTTIEEIMGVDNGVHLHHSIAETYALNLDNPKIDFMVV